MPETHIRFNRQALQSEETGGEPVSAAYLVIDRMGRVVSESASTSALLNRPPESSLSGALLLEQFSWLPQELLDYSPPSKYFEFESQLKNPADEKKWLQISIFPVDKNQSDCTSLVILRDVSARRLADSELAETYKHYWSLFEASSDAIFLETFDGTIFDCNSACERLYGFSRSELLCMNARDLVPGDFVSTIEGLKPELDYSRISGQGIHLEGVGKRKDGSIFPDEVTINFVKIAGEECFAVTIRDITFRREIESTRQRYENQVLQLQKLDNLGQMASGLANDFNNLLTGIMGYADLMLRELPPAGSTREKARRIVEAARKASEIIQQLMSYTGKLPSLYQRTNMGLLLKEMQSVFQQLMNGNIAFSFTVAPELPEINVDPPMIKQALLNIVKNSVEAIGANPTGQIEISAFPGLCSYYGNEPGYFGPPIKAGSYMVLKIRDNGSGIEQEHLNRIFDPFFTTRFAGRGLGLSAVLGMLRSHRGAVYVTSTPGQGTEFAVFLPFDSGNLVCENNPEKQQEEKFPAGVALIIDDDLNVREILADNLKSLGYETFLASDGREGLSLFKSLHQKLSVVITDLVMPGLSGSEVIKEMRWLNPGIPLMVCTGLLIDEKRSELENLGVAAILEKPFTIRELEKHFMRIQLKFRGRKTFI